MPDIHATDSYARESLRLATFGDPSSIDRDDARALTRMLDEADRTRAAVEGAISDLTGAGVSTPEERAARALYRLREALEG